MPYRDEAYLPSSVVLERRIGHFIKMVYICALDKNRGTLQCKLKTERKYKDDIEQIGICNETCFNRKNTCSESLSMQASKDGFALFLVCLFRRVLGSKILLEQKIYVLSENNISQKTAMNLQKFSSIYNNSSNFTINSEEFTIKFQIYSENYTKLQK
jgi:hypothetical protein